MFQQSPLFQAEEKELRESIDSYNRQLVTSKNKKLSDRTVLAFKKGKAYIWQSRGSRFNRRNDAFFVRRENKNLPDPSTSSSVVSLQGS